MCVTKVSPSTTLPDQGIMTSPPITYWTKGGFFQPIQSVGWILYTKFNQQMLTHSNLAPSVSQNVSCQTHSWTASVRKEHAAMVMVDQSL